MAWIGISECGKSLGSKTHGFQISVFWIDAEGRKDLIPSLATAKYMDMFRGERNTVFRPCNFDDGKFFKVGSEMVKAFLYPAELDALLYARWGGSGFDLHSTRQGVSQQFDSKLAAKLAGRDSITNEEFVQLVKPTFDPEADDIDWDAFKRRFHFIVITESGIFHRDASKVRGNVPLIAWPHNDSKDIFKPHVTDLLTRFKNGMLKEVPSNYEADTAWSQAYLKKESVL